MTKPIPVAIQWRDESYGDVVAYAAFRIYQDTFDWSQAAHKRFQRACKLAGFTFHHGRCSWIAEPKRGDCRNDEDPAVRREVMAGLLERLTEAGFQPPAL